MDKLRPILTNLNINQIVSLDDEHCRNIISEISDEEIEQYIVNVDLSREEKMYLYDAGYQFISELITDENIICENILGKINNKLSESAATLEINMTPLDWLEAAIEEIGSRKLKYKKISKTKDITTINKENTLWILDKDLAGADSISQSISKIKSIFNDCLNIFIIYTYDQSMNELNLNWEKRYTFVKSLGFNDTEASQLAYELYVLTKPVNPQCKEKSGFKALILNSVIGHTVFSVYKNMQYARNEVYSQFDELIKKINFDRLITFKYNVENEGEHNIYKLLNNILNLMELQHYNKYMIQDENYVNTFKKVISHASTQGDNKDMLGTLELMNTEYLWNKYQSIDPDINLAYTDIQFGDVFELNLSEFYKRKYKLNTNHVIGILISQSCDCIIRKDNNITRNDTILKLLLFEEQSLISNENVKSIYQNGIFLYKNSNNEPRSYISNDKSVGILCIDDAILDLSTLNSNGEAIILNDEKLTSSIELKKPNIWKNKMFENMKRENIINKEIELLDKEIQSMFLENKYGLKYNYDHEKFEINRIGRLTYNNAHTVLSHYINNISRVGKESPSVLKLSDV